MRKQSFGRPTSTRCVSSCVCSMAWSFHVVAVTALMVDFHTDGARARVEPAMRRFRASGWKRRPPEPSWTGRRESNDARQRRRRHGGPARVRAPGTSAAPTSRHRVRSRHARVRSGKARLGREREARPTFAQFEAFRLGAARQRQLGRGRAPVRFVAIQSRVNAAERVRGIHYSARVSVTFVPEQSLSSSLTRRRSVSV